MDGVVADTANPSTGLTHDWSINAGVRPWGVNVNSRVKGPDGFKDPGLLEAFLRAARPLGQAST